jgi:hypothetical protein
VWVLVCAALIGGVPAVLVVLSTLVRPLFAYSPGPPIPWLSHLLEPGIVFEILLMLVYPWCLLVLLPVLINGAVRARGNRRGQFFGVILLGLVPCLAPLLYSLPFTAHLRQAAFTDFAIRSRPFVSAITRFEREHGTPPASLAALVPAYLPVIPPTNLRAFPEYRYFSRGSHPGAWELTVPCLLRGKNEDFFFYHPSQRYHTQDLIERFGGCVCFDDTNIERFGEWVYLPVHVH